MIERYPVLFNIFFGRAFFLHASRLPLTSLVLALTVCGARVVLAQDAKEVVNQMVGREDAAGLHKQNFFYVASERSERTGGHLWKERVAETNAGKVRLLLAEDDQPISAERAAKERARLSAIVADPSGFTAAEHAKKSDEEKAKAMLDLLPKAFLLKNAHTEGDLIHIDFEPNPEYKTQSMEEKVLHGMSGTLTVDAHALRLHEIAARLPKDVSVGFGLASIHAGSSFQTVRVMVTPGEWKTSVVDTNINGKAILFKSLGKNEHVTRTDFKQLPLDTTVAQAVEMVERSQPEGTKVPR